jgi:hypothetical protein
MDSRLREAFLKRLTVDSPHNDRRRKDFNQAIFDAKEGWAVFDRTDLDMVLNAYDMAVRDVERLPPVPAPDNTVRVPYRLLVTGSRDWPDNGVVGKTLAHNIDGAWTHDSYNEFVVVHGSCTSGADAQASAFVHNYKNPFFDESDIILREEPHPARWDAYGNTAGFRRNAEMVAQGADICLAFIAPCTKKPCRKPLPHGSHGATHCADLAEKAGIKTYRLFFGMEVPA